MQQPEISIHPLIGRLRYKYPELDTYQKRAKIPSQELSDYLVKELTKKEK